MKALLFDTEGDGLLDTVTRLWCAVGVDYETGHEYIFTPDNIGDFISLLETYPVIIGHNIIGYDLAALRKLYGWDYRGRIIDTLLMSRQQRPNRTSSKVPKAPHSVEAWGHRFGTYKKEHEDWSQFSPAMLERCRQDVLIQRKIYDALLEEGEGEGWEEAHKLNAVLFSHLQKQEEYGWLFDKEWASHCIATLDRWMERIDKVTASHLPLIVEIEETKKDGDYNCVSKPFVKSGAYAEISKRFLESVGIKEGVDEDRIIGGPFSRVAFRPVSLDSNKETKEFLLSQGWEPKEWNVNEDGEATSPKLNKDDPFIGIQGSLGKLIAKRVQCRHRRSQIQGWLEAVRPDGRIGAKVGGIASTGRLKHAVIVNVPGKSFFGKWMRRCFIAKEGWVLVGTDSKSNQIRQLAACMDDPKFTAFVVTDADIHERNKEISGVASRDVAKTLYYATVFGSGNAKIGKISGGGIEAGKKLKDKFFTALPLLPAFLEEEQNKWRPTAQKWYNKKYKRMEYRNGYIKGLDGRPILVEFEKDILAYHLQSMEAIQMAAAYCVLHKWLERAGYKWKEDYGFVIWMHDEWQIECRKEIAEHVAQLSCRAISWAGEYYGIKCPHEGEAKIGKNWKETH